MGIDMIEFEEIYGTRNCEGAKFRDCAQFTKVGRVCLLAPAGVVVVQGTG